MDWKNLVGTVAPMLASAITGPLGGAAVDMIGHALGLDEKTEATVKQALQGVTPEQMLALKNADQAFAEKMQELGFANAKDMEQLAFQDRDSARQREAKVGDKTARNLAYAITVGFFGIMAALMLVSLPKGSENVLYVMLGSLGTAWTGVVAYYFGSTQHAARSTELLAKAQPVVEDGVTPPNPYAN